MPGLPFENNVPSPSLVYPLDPYCFMPVNVDRVTHNNGSLTYSTYVMSDSTSKIVFNFQNEDLLPIQKVGFRHGTKTGSSPIYYKIGIHGSNNLGLPDTIKSGINNQECSVVINNQDYSGNTTLLLNLGDLYQPSGYGEFLNLVIEYVSGSVSSSNNSSFGLYSSNHFDLPRLQYPQSYTLLSGIATRSTDGKYPLSFHLVSGDIPNPGRGILPPNSQSQVSITSSGDFIEVRFYIPRKNTEYYSVMGLEFNIQSETSLTNFSGQFVIFNEQHDILQSNNFVCHQLQVGSQTRTNRIMFNPTNSHLTLRGDKIYGAGIRLLTNGNFNLTKYDFDSLDYSDGHPFFEYASYSKISDSLTYYPSSILVISPIFAYLQESPRLSQQKISNHMI